MLKRTLAILIATLALMIGRASAADAPAQAAPDAAAHVSAIGHEAAPAGGEQAGHIEGDERLVPIPPSKDTIVSAVWVIIIFVVMLGILYKTAWTQVLAGLKARENRIRQDIADAEANRAKAEATLKEYSAQLATAEGTIRDMMTQATADAEKVAQSLRMQAQQESEEIKERATREIETARKAAVADIYAQAADLSTSIASKILKRNLNVDDQRSLVSSSLEEFQAAKKA